ncbi:MAG TPA: glycosyltransferase family 4 protein [bacterium]|nr:glycosyltransferase family 4 protein [bacterium]
MKINFIVQGYYPAFGGSELLIKNLAEGLKKNFRHTCEVFTTNVFSCDAFNNTLLPRMKEGEEIINGIKVRRYDITGKYPVFFERLSEFCNEAAAGGLAEIAGMLKFGPRSLNMYFSLFQKKCDLIYASSFPFLHILCSLLISKLKKTKYVIHGNFHIDDKLFDNETNKYIVKNCSGYICNTKIEYDYFIKNGVSPKKLAVIPPPVVEIKTNLLEKKVCRNKLGLPDKTVILYFGQLLKNKNIEILINSFADVAGNNKNICLVIAGSGYANYYPRLQKISAALTEEISNRIFFFINADEETKNLIFQAADIFVFPSLYESFGIVIPEAWSYKLPVIASDIEQIKTTVKNNKSGLIFQRRDKKDLSDKIKLLIDNADLRNQLSESGYNEFIEKFNKDYLIEKNDCFLKSLFFRRQ